jgi:predicted transcriptional regulator
MHLPTAQDLRERRNELELTQSELADRADVSQPLIARIEGGDEAEGDVVRAGDVMNEHVVSVRPDDSVRAARDLMLGEGYSQLPVIRDDQPQGIISNSDIRQASEETTGETGVGDLPVADVMHGSYSTVEPDAPLEQIDNYLDHSAAVIVVEDGHVVGIITEADVAARLS